MVLDLILNWVGLLSEYAVVRSASHDLRLGGFWVSLWSGGLRLWVVGSWVLDWLVDGVWVCAQAVDIRLHVNLLRLHVNVLRLHVNLLGLLPLLHHLASSSPLCGTEPAEHDGQDTDSSEHSPPEDFVVPVSLHSPLLSLLLGQFFPILRF